MMHELQTMHTNQPTGKGMQAKYSKLKFRCIRYASKGMQAKYSIQGKDYLNLWIKKIRCIKGKGISKGLDKGEGQGKGKGEGQDKGKSKG